MRSIFLYLSGCAIILLMLIPVCAKSENPVIIRGRVIGQDKKPVPYASVYIALPKTPGSIIKGAISDDQGTFSLSAEKNKAYILKVTFLGYKEHIMKIQPDSIEQNIGNVVLEEMPYKMSEVVVKPPLQVTADKIIFNFENDPGRLRSNLHEMISKMPMISIGPMGKISVGSENKTYIVLRKGREDALVNFQNVSFEEMLKRLPAMGFTSFEIWTVVPPKYEKYDYVINIIPDPSQRLFGAVGSPEASYNFDNGELRTGIGGNGSANIFRVAGGVKYAYANAPKKISETNTIFYARDNDPETLIHQKETNYSNHDMWMANLTASWDISKRQFITFNLNASFRDSGNEREITSEETPGENMPFESHANYTTTYESDSWKFNVTYQQDFRKSDRSLNVSYLTEQAPSLKYDARKLSHAQATAIDENESAKNKVKNQTHRLQFDYYDLFLNKKLKFIAQAGYLMMNHRSEGITLNELTGLEDVNHYTLFEQDFHRMDGFANFAYNMNRKLNISTKADIDYQPAYNRTRSITGTFEEHIKQQELLFNMEGIIFYQFNIAEPKKEDTKSFDEMTPKEKVAYIAKQMATGKSAKDIMNNSSVTMPNSSLRFNYMYRQRRPGVSQLTNYSDEQDPLYIRRGNSNLYPEKYHVISVRFNSWFLNSFSSSFSFSNNQIVSQTRKEDNRLVQSFYNSGKKRDFSIGASHSFFKNKVSILSDFGSWYVNFGDGTWKKWQRLNIGAKYNLSISTFCNAAFKANYYKIFNSGAEGTEELLPLNLSMELSWGPKIWGKQFFIIAEINDALRWNKRTEKYTDMPDYHQFIEARHNRIPLYLSIRTTLGKFKVKPVKTTKSNAKVSGFSTDVE